MPNTSIWPMDRTLSGVTTPSQSGPESIGNEGVLHILQSSTITGVSSSDCLVSCAEMQSVYSATLADWAAKIKVKETS